MEATSREARRRRILDRGSDRLALITGRIETIPSKSSSSHHTHTASSPPEFFLERDLQTNLSDQSNVVQYDQETSASVFMKHESSERIAFDSEKKVEPQLRKCETSIEAARVPSLDLDNKQPPTLISSNSHRPSTVPTVDTEPRQPREQPQNRDGFFTLNKISSSITASEIMRICCSILIALVVVFSYTDMPLASNNIIKNIKKSRPLYLVLLTDITIVLAWLLLLEKRRISVKADEEARKVPLSYQYGWDYGYGWAEGVGKALETALVVSRAGSAVLMDCSVYIVVVICGVSLVQYLL